MQKAHCWIYVSRGVADGLLDMAFDPAISDRYPATDHKDFQMPQIMHHFCFPHGIRFVLAREQEIPMPRWSMFVLTQGDGTRVYGACVTFYEVMTSQEIDWLEEQYGGENKMSSKEDDDRVTATQMSLRVLRSELYKPTAIALLSHHPCCDAMKNVLGVLYRISLSTSDHPLEHYIGHLLNSRTCRGHRSVNVDWNGAVTTFPPTRDWEGLPVTNFSWTLLFSALSVGNVLEVLRLMLLEKKVVFISKHTHQITVVAESIRNLMFPLNLSRCVYIPVCPDVLRNYIRAPIAFVMGFNKSSIDIRDIPDDVFVIDLDNNDVYPCVDVEARGPPLCGVHVNKCANILKHEVETRCQVNRRRSDEHIHETGFVFRGSTAARGDGCLSVRAEPRESVIRGAVLQVMCAILKGYEPCLNMAYNLEPTGLLEDMFDKKRFVQGSEPSLRNFISELVETSPFISFVEACSQASSEIGSQFSRLYFDRCLQCFQANQLPATPDGEVGHVPDLKERLVLLQREPFENRDRVEPVTYKLPPSNVKAKSTTSPQQSNLDRWPSKLNESLMPEGFRTPLGLKSKKSATRKGKEKMSSLVSSFIFRTSEERSICAFQGSWDLDHVANKAKRETQIKHRFDLLLVDIHGTWAITIPSRVSSSRIKLPSLRHRRLQEVITFLTKADVCQIDQTLFRAYFEACVRSGTATRNDVEIIYKCLDRRMSSSRPNALTYGQFSLAMSHVQKFCPYNWTQSNLEKRRRRSREYENGSKMLQRRDKSERLRRRLSASPLASDSLISSSLSKAHEENSGSKKKTRKPFRRRVLSMGSSTSPDILESPKKELCIWSLTPCDHCGYVR